MKLLLISSLLVLFQRQPVSVHYFYNSGWMIETEKHVMVIDFIPHETSKTTIDFLKEHLKKSTVAGKKIVVFVTHSHEDHFSEKIFQLANEIPGIQYILGWDYKGQPQGVTIHTINKRDSFFLKDLKIYTHEANDEGVGFLIEADGQTIYHGGDHALWVEEIRQAFLDEIKYIRSKTKQVDLAFLPAVRGTFTKCAYDSVMEAGLKSSIDILQPATIALQHLACEDKLGTYKEIYTKLADKYQGKKWIIPEQYNQLISY